MKILRSIFLSLLLLGVVACAWFVPLKDSAVTQVDSGLKRALITFASARALGGVLSVVQAAQLDIQPAGIGVTLSPGQILAPINDLIKHFADFMLLVCVAFGIQKILIILSEHQWISIALTLIALGWIYLLLLNKGMPKWLNKVLIIFLMLRFAMPLTFMGTDALSTHFLMTQYKDAQQAIFETTTKTESGKEVLSPQAEKAAPGWFPKLPDLPNITEIKERYSKIKQDLEKSAEHIINLIVVFFLQTILFPLIFMFALYLFIKNIFEIKSEPSHVLISSN